MYMSSQHYIIFALKIILEVQKYINNFGQFQFYSSAKGYQSYSHTPNFKKKGLKL